MQTADYRPLPIRPPHIALDSRPDGSIIIEQDYAMPTPWRSIAHLFMARAAEHPDRDFIAKREALPGGGWGDWRRITYGEAAEKVRALAQAFIDRGLGPEASVMVVSGPSIEHGLVHLAALIARAPYAPLSTGYCLLSSDYARLKHAFDLCKPKLIFADEGPAYEAALSALPLDGVEVVTLTPPKALKATPLADLLATTPTAQVEVSLDAIHQDIHAKTIFTSGSTGAPKGVIITQRMLTAVIAQHDALYIRDEADDPRAYLSWMPWSHVGASNMLFNDTINDAATLYIDDGKPTPELFGETIRNLREVSPSEYNSTPIFYSHLATAMERDPALRDHFFKRLRFMTYATAGLSQDLFDRLQALAVAATGQRIAIGTKYGSTEAQGITIVSTPLDQIGPIGLPFPGVTVKLARVGDKLEVRAKGDTIMPGYLHNPEATAKAFDEEGFYCTGDAAYFADPAKPELGLMFDGRVTENFKLASGTWVSVGALRLALIQALAPIVQDCVIAGHDREEITVLAWPRLAEAAAVAGVDPAAGYRAVLASPTVRDTLAERLRAHNAAAGGSSRRVARLLLLGDPPAGDEIAEKGYINQRAALAKRAAEVTRLYAPQPDPELVVA